MNLQPTDPNREKPTQKGFVDAEVYSEAQRICQDFARENASLPSSDLLIALIALGIEAGANTMPSLIGAVRSAQPLSNRQIAVVVHQENGSDPSRYRWHADANGYYSLHEGGFA